MLYFIAPKSISCTNSTVHQLSCLRRYIAHCSQLLPLDERFESLHEILNAHFFALPLLFNAGNLLWRNKHVADHLDNPVFGDTIFNGNLGKSIDFDADDSAKTENINAQRFIFEQCFEVNLRD